MTNQILDAWKTDAKNIGEYGYDNPEFDRAFKAGVNALNGGTDARKGIRAYHGSPHDFDKFDISKIGTGEGAQAYGHGLYFAGNEAVAQSYKQALQQVDTAPFDAVGIAPKDWNAARMFAQTMDASAPEAAARDFAQWTGRYEVTPDLVEAFRASKKPGHMYEVNINANPEDFLDWDKPLREQPPIGRDAINRVGRDVKPYGLDKIPDDMRMVEARRLLNDPEAVARLREAGVPGIKYLDQGSRAAGDGSRNYVVFDDKLISLIRKYGFAGAGIGAGTLIMLGGGSWDAQAGELITGQELMDRIQGGDVITGGAGDDTIKGAGEEVDYTAPAAIQNVYDAYQTGKMTPEQESEYIGDVLNGTMKAAGPLRVPDGIWKAYAAGQMDDEQRAEFEADVNAGMWERPSNESETWIGGIWNAITGEDRAVKSTEALPSWYNMPLGSLTDPKAWKASVGAFFASPEEAVKIIRTQFPDIEARQDAAGSYILKSPADGKEYAIKPGMEWGDLIRIIPGMAAFTPAGRAATTIGGMAIAAGTEAAIQASQAATGGDFDPEQVPLAALGEGGGRMASKVIGKGVTAARKAISGTPAAVASDAAGAGAKATSEVAGDAIPPESIGELVRKESKGGKGSEEAVRALAKEAKVNPAALAAAQRRGFDLPADVLIDDPMVKEAVGLTRSLRASEASVAFDQSINRAIDQADEALKQIGASPDISSVNEKIKAALTKARNGLEASAKKLYTQVDDAIPKQSPVDLSNLKKTLDEIADELGGVEAMTPVEKKLLALANAEETATYGRLIR